VAEMTAKCAEEVATVCAQTHVELRLQYVLKGQLVTARQSPLAEKVEEAVRVALRVRRSLGVQEPGLTSA